MTTDAQTRVQPQIPDPHHRDVTGGWLRPAVFGISDGLVSNTALIVGVAGASVSTRTIIVTGLAGLASGALSMATGEYVSVASQTELTRAEIELEKSELRRVPAAEQRELAQIYVERGLEPELAKEVARQLHRDPEKAWRIHAREELGVDPDDLPSPWVAAGSSFAAFSIGAALPVVPYLLGASTLLITVLLAAAALFLTGAAVSRFTSRTWWYSGSRQLALGALAGLVTYGIGSAIGSGGV
ncbi:MAG TPA: VIT1/CCC1 transporter family protein [Mycobacteriales bacterium]|nr:VIT1/CCC1 transporter family protein [Mycobacteriales bacterium]